MYSHKVAFCILQSNLVTSLLKAQHCYFFPIYLGTSGLLPLAHELSSLRADILYLAIPMSEEVGGTEGVRAKGSYILGTLSLFLSEFFFLLL